MKFHFRHKCQRCRSLGALCVLWILVLGGAQQSSKLDCQPGPHESSTNDPLTAPDRFVVHWNTSASENQVISLEVIREWSPIGADRFYQLIRDNFYNCAAFFRVVPNFVVQFGLAAEPDETAKWQINIKDDPKFIQSNTKGTVSFATAGPDTRTTQIFVNLADNAFLDDMGFTPFARVTAGLEVLQSIYNPTPGDSGGVPQDEIETKGNAWLPEKYPLIEIITSTRLEENDSSSGKSHHQKPVPKSYNIDDADSTFTKAGKSWIAVLVVLEVGMLLVMFRRG